MSLRDAQSVEGQGKWKETTVAVIVGNHKEEHMLFFFCTLISATAAVYTRFSLNSSEIIPYNLNSRKIGLCKAEAGIYKVLNFFCDMAYSMGTQSLQATGSMTVSVAPSKLKLSLI